MVTIAEISPTAQLLYIKQLYQLQKNQMKNTSEYLKFRSEIVIGTIREILEAKNSLIAQNCLNTSGELKHEGKTPSITWNIMSIVNCRPRVCACRLCLTEKL